MSAARSLRRRFWCLGVAMGLLGWAGCRPALEASKQASPLPLLERDPAENGRAADRWPGWRGANGSGIAPAGSPAIRFSRDEGVRWKVDVPGSSNSSPVVWEDVVLLTTALADADPPPLALLCFDRTLGTLLWQVEAGKARGRTHAKNGYASASVATDGERIFAFFGSTGLFCYDFSGKRLWRVELGDLDHQWGTAASPVLYGDTVIQVCDSAEDSYVAAFDKTNGRRIWRTLRPSYGCWSTPAFVEVETGGLVPTEMIVNGTAAKSADRRLVVAYDPADGRELWRVQGTAELVVPTALVGGGLVFSTSGRNGPIMAIRPGGNGDVTHSRVVWRARRGGPYIPTGVLYRNRLFLISDAGKLTCYNAGNGNGIWSARLRGPFSSSLVAADGRIYAVNERGTVYVFEAADSFQLLAENELGARCLATPAMADGDLLIRTESELFCIAGKRAGAGVAQREPKSDRGSVPPPDAASDAPPADTDPDPPPGGAATEPPLGDAGAEPSPAADMAGPPPATAGAAGNAWPLFRGNPQATGVARSTLPDRLELLWTFSVEDGGFESTAAIARGTVYIGCLDGKLYAVDLAQGKQQWEFPTELGFTASAAVRDGLVYIGDWDGRFYCVDAASGEPKWDFPTEAEINSSANFYKDRVLFGSQDGLLYCLKAATGEKIWAYESDDMIQCSPTVVGNRAFVAGCDGRLHVIDLDKGTRVADVDIEAPTLCTPAVLGRMAFVGTTGNTVFGIDWRASRVVWRYDGRNEFRSSAAVTPEAVIVGSRDKRLHAIDVKSGQGLWTFTAKARVDGSPVVAGSRVFAGSADGRLYALDLKTGRRLWQFEAGGSIVASPAVAEGRLVIGTDEGDLYCFGAKQPQ